MADITIDVTPDDVFAIEQIFRDDGRLPWINEEVATAGYQNVMLGVAPPSLFGHTITFRGVPMATGFWLPSIPQVPPTRAEIDGQMRLGGMNDE